MAAAEALPSTYKRVVVREAKGDFIIEDVPMPAVGPREVLVRVEACGMCHSDCFVKEGSPLSSYPRVPGHEVAGVIVAAGAEVKHFQVGQRVGRGWEGGHCGVCDFCRRGDPLFCAEHRITGINTDGGCAQYMLCTTESLARLPDNLPFEECGPLMCAGVTVFNSLRHVGAIPPALVAVQGVGGLGHLAIQFARKLGFQVVALSTSDDKKALAHELGAHFYINTKTHDAVKELQKLGGARVLIATAFDAAAVTALLPGLSIDGAVLQLGADFHPVAVNPLQFLSMRQRYQGWPSGQALDSQDTAKFASYTGVKTYVQTFPLEKVNEAYKMMMENKARFRAVLTPNKH
jgi:propanol-preferring alcohol dehydrogenase